MLGAIVGFVAPFLPDVVKLFKQRLDHKQEMEMLELRLTHASKEHEWRMREIETAADAADLRSARKPRESYGVQLLNAAAGHVGENAVIAPKTFSRAFLLFTLTDLFSAAVRPVITYWIVGLWGTIKMALLYSLYSTAGGGWQDKIVNALTAEGVWTGFDQDVLAVVIGFWFGWRTRQRAAGQR